MNSQHTSRAIRVLTASALAVGAVAATAPLSAQARTVPAVTSDVSVPNPSFEAAVGDYAPTTGSSMWRVAVPYDGQYGLHLVARTAGSAFASPKAPIVGSTSAGSTYAATVYASPVALGRTARIELVESSADGQTVGVTASSAELAGSGWQKITVSRTAVGEGNTLNVRLGSPALGVDEAIRFDALGATVTAPAYGVRDVVFGTAAASKNEILAHESDLGTQLAGVRQYRKWNSVLFPADSQWARDTGHTLYVSIRSERTDGTKITYADVAAAAPGSGIHNQLLNQAQQIKSFGAKVYIAYNHEPEASEASAMGTGPEFVAAWRKVIDVYRQAGVTNAEYVWTMTGYSFRRTDARAAVNYWPGADYVDAIGADVYNWGACRTEDGGWASLAQAVDPLRKWAQQYPTKPIVLMEYSSVEDPNQPGRKAQWIAEATTLFQQPGYEQFQGALQWSGRNYTHTLDCDFDYLSSDSSKSAMRAMAASPLFSARMLDIE